VEQLSTRRRRRCRAEVRSREQYDIVGVSLGVGLELTHQVIRFRRRDTPLRSREIQSMERETAIEHVCVRVDYAGNDGVAVKIHDLGVVPGLLADFTVATDGGDLRVGYEKRLGPRVLRITREDVSVTQHSVRGKRGAPA